MFVKRLLIKFQMSINVSLNATFKTKNYNACYYPELGTHIAWHYTDVGVADW